MRKQSGGLFQRDVGKSFPGSSVLVSWVKLQNTSKANDMIHYYYWLSIYTDIYKLCARRPAAYPVVIHRAALLSLMLIGITIEITGMGLSRLLNQFSCEHCLMEVILNSTVTSGSNFFAIFQPCFVIILKEILSD